MLGAELDVVLKNLFTTHRARHSVGRAVGVEVAVIDENVLFTLGKGAATLLALEAAGVEKLPTSNADSGLTHKHSFMADLAVALGGSLVPQAGLVDGLALVGDKGTFNGLAAERAAEAGGGVVARPQGPHHPALERLPTGATHFGGAAGSGGTLGVQRTAVALHKGASDGLATGPASKTVRMVLAAQCLQP